eukprot:scaffold378_cov248-Pinguiococcus_pyrenoidosus.AAC.5
MATVGTIYRYLARRNRAPIGLALEDRWIGDKSHKRGVPPTARSHNFGTGAAASIRFPILLDLGPFRHDHANQPCFFSTILLPKSRTNPSSKPSFGIRQPHDSRASY